MQLADLLHISDKTFDDSLPSPSVSYRVPKETSSPTQLHHTLFLVLDNDSYSHLMVEALTEEAFCFDQFLQCSDFESLRF